MSTPLTRSWLQKSILTTLQGFGSRWKDESDHDPYTYRALIIAGQHLGHVQGYRATTLIDTLAELALPFQCSPQTIELLTEETQLEPALNQLALALRRKGLLPGWRNELHTLYSLEGLPLCHIERALFKALGLRSQAIHVHAETTYGLIWLGVRSHTKHENPGMLDNLTAGGVAAREPLLRSIERELFEEAGFQDLKALLDVPSVPGFVDLNEALTGHIEPRQWQESCITVSRPLANGWHHETLVLCHLRLAPWWTPGNQDGEVAGFELRQPAQCIDALNRWAFTPDAALVTALALSGGLNKDWTDTC
ncbi:MAG: hypothetical protein R3194_09050 [Limnobacter sp.]|nr:hypothetical protein [Limnobacter sp.]